MAMLLDSVGGLLHWIASIYDGEQKISSAISYRKTCRVCLLFFLTSWGCLLAYTFQIVSSDFIAYHGFQKFPFHLYVGSKWVQCRINYLHYITTLAVVIKSFSLVLIIGHLSTSMSSNSAIESFSVLCILLLLACWNHYTI